MPNETGNTFDFGWAIKLLKDGKYVSREGWHKTDMCIYLQPESSGEEGYFGPVIVLCINPDEFQQGWLASQTDILAEDWYEVETEI